VQQAKFLRALQRRIAQGAIGSSTLRGQPRGTAKAARDALARTNLERFVVSSQSEFAKELNRDTARIRRNLPPPAQWGTARKAQNIFLRNALYNRYLADEFHLEEVEEWLELPLDSYTVKALQERAPDRLPPFRGVGAVDPSRLFASDGACTGLPQTGQRQHVQR
jgi:hypothetical protein